MKGAIVLLLLLTQTPLTKLPSVTRMVQAEYPPRAMLERVEAKVIVEIDVAATGRVEGAEVVQSSTVARSSFVRSSTVSDYYGFEAAALTAARQLEFEPAEEGEGNPVPVRIPFTFNFTLPESPPIAAVETATSATATVADAPRPALPGIVNFRGVIRERGNRAPIAGALVTVFRGEGEQAAGFEARSGPEGEFTLRDLDPGEWRVLAEADGYFPFRTTETIEPAEALEVTYYLEKATNNPYDVLVEASRPKKEVNRRTLTVQEIVKVPGTLGDPILVVENLPGVARAQPGLIIVRGSGPEDTDVYIDGVSVPLIYHFGGLRSVIPAEMIENIDFYPGNFSAYYGRAIGGVLDARSKRPNPDRIHGSLDVSLLDTSLYLEVPIGEDAAIALAGRRSYVDLILKAAIPDDASVSLTTAPRYYDYQLLGRWRPTQGQDARLFVFGSDDALSLVFEQPGDLDAQIQSGRLDTATGFNRAVLDHELISGDFKNIARLSVGRDALSFTLGDQFRFILDFITLQARNTASYQVSDSVTLSAGLDAVYVLADLDIRLPRPPKEGDASMDNEVDDVIVANLTDIPAVNAGPFVEAELEITDRLTVVPGLRLDYFYPVGDVVLEPRLSARYKLGDQWTAKAGAGLTHQEPSPDETDESFGNPDLGVERSLQVSAGAEYRPLSFLTIDATLFYKAMDHLVSRTDAVVERNGKLVPQVYDNGGTGRVYGLELYVRHDFSNNLRGWLTYTLSRAERLDSGEAQHRLFDFDQTHIFAVVASYQFPENWELGVRWRVVSGSPTTPIIGGVFRSDLDSYQQIPGAVNSARLPLFHQLDVRVDKSWIWDTWKLSAYLSLINAYNRPNVDGFIYNYDFSQRTEQQGLPVLPILGLKAEL